MKPNLFSKISESKAGRIACRAFVGANIVFSLSLINGCEGSDQRMARQAAQMQAARVERLDLQYAKLESNRKKINSLNLTIEFERLTHLRDMAKDEIKVMLDDPRKYDTTSIPVNNYALELNSFQKQFKTADSTHSVSKADAAIIFPKLDSLARHSPVLHAQWVKNQSRLLNSILNDVDELKRMPSVRFNPQALKIAHLIEAKLVRLNNGFKKELGSNWSLPVELEEFSNTIKRVYYPVDIILNPQSLRFSPDFWTDVKTKADSVFNYRI